MRHDLIRCFDPAAGISVSTLAYEYSPGFLVPEHAHGSDQLIYATRGVMEICSGRSLWIIPPHFAIWVPARTRHRIRMPAAVSMRTLYFRPSLAPRLPRICTVLPVTPFLRELVLEAVRLGKLRARNRRHAALRDLLLWKLESASPVPTWLTLPEDPRALAVAEAAIAGMERSPSLASLCQRGGASVRTVERVFLSEVGMTFETWRRQARLMKGVEYLAGGAMVKEAAYQAGYRQPSAFIALFRQVFGASPKAWLWGLGERG